MPLNTDGFSVRCLDPVFFPLHFVFLFHSLVTLRYGSSLKVILVKVIPIWQVPQLPCSSSGKSSIIQLKFAKRFTPFDLFNGSFISGPGFAWE